jgi:hypothetical protein
MCEQVIANEGELLLCPDSSLPIEIVQLFANHRRIRVGVNAAVSESPGNVFVERHDPERSEARSDDRAMRVSHLTFSTSGRAHDLSKNA